MTNRPNPIDAGNSDRIWAPLALFIYKRPEHTRQMIASLQDCEGFAQSPIYVFADGPKQPEDVPSCREARAEARRLLGRDAIYLERDVNIGIEDSLIAGVTDLCDRHGLAVVIEEDLIVSPHFLKFLNTGLRRYEDEPRVMQVCGYMYDVPQFNQRTDAFFLPMTSSLGWATWKRAWDQFDREATNWRVRLRDEQDRKRFDLDGQFNYSRMLSRHMNSGNPAWDIRWYYSVFSAGGFALFPPRTLVFHAGFDGTGTHDRFAMPAHQAALETKAIFDMPGQVAVASDAGLVFEAAGKFRPSSTMRKAVALAKFVVRRVGQANVAALWSRPRRRTEAESGNRGGGTPTGGTG